VGEKVIEFGAVYSIVVGGLIVVIIFIWVIGYKCGGGED
jgi:hypothetical protein